MVRCKFTCTEVVKRKGWKSDGSQPFVYEAKFGIVHDGSEENKKFFAATPTGSLTVGTYTEDVFEVGKDYYLDLTLSGGN